MLKPEYFATCRQDSGVVGSASEAKIVPETSCNSESSSSRSLFLSNSTRTVEENRSSKRQTWRSDLTDKSSFSVTSSLASAKTCGWTLAGTLAWGRKSIDHHGDRFEDDAFVVEASVKHAGWTAYARGETTENRELVHGQHDRAYDVGKLSLGALRDVRVGERLVLGIGGLVSVNFIPADLRDAYGSRRPLGAMAFARLKLE